ncbi:MAG: peptide chain release factor N(5)-glutamine methyltransferase [Bacteroidaceae bacterium]|nr:peptide chain release factor N(5)-glutamine methyltransferase [Bacteroidaceae bacterium]
MFRTLRTRLAAVYPDGEAQAIVFLVLEKLFGLSRTDVLMGGLERLTAEQTAELEQVMLRLERGEPVQYVLGVADFDGMTLGVAPGVLIPRPETEELVEWIAEDFKSAKRLRILDIGTGSGCIALSLARRFTDASVTAWDISDDALRIASANAERLGLDVEFKKRDALCTEVAEADVANYDIIVSNPPYICDKERVDMDNNVLQHEPETALFVPDNDPLLFYRAISDLAQKMLRSGGGLYFEINREYGKETAGMMSAMGFDSVELRKDFMENDRMVKGTKR